MSKKPKTAKEAAPKRRGAPTKLGSEPVIQTIRLPKEVYNGVMREKIERELANGRNVSFSSIILSMIEASIKASDRRRSKALKSAEAAKSPDDEQKAAPQAQA